MSFVVVSHPHSTFLRNKFFKFNRFPQFLQTIVRRPYLQLQGNLEIAMKKKSELKPEVAFGHVIRELRNQHNISQEKLALISDMDRTFISLLERGLRQPSLKSILRLSESLKIRPGELIERVVERLPQKTKSDL